MIKNSCKSSHLLLNMFFMLFKSLTSPVVQRLQRNPFVNMMKVLLFRNYWQLVTMATGRDPSARRRRVRTSSKDTNLFCSWKKFREAILILFHSATIRSQLPAEMFSFSVTSWKVRFNESLRTYFIYRRKTCYISIFSSIIQNYKFVLKNVYKNFKFKYNKQKL